MDIRKLSIATGTAVLAFAATAGAAPTSVVSADNVSVRPPIEEAAFCYRRLHWRHACVAPRYYGYAAPVAAAPAAAAPAAPVAATAPVGYYGFAAPAASVPLVALDGIYCKTSLKTCLLREAGWLGTGCSCRVPDGLARGVVE